MKEVEEKGILKYDKLVTIHDSDIKKIVSILLEEKNVVFNIFIYFGLYVVWIWIL